MYDGVWVGESEAALTSCAAACAGMVGDVAGEPPLEMEMTRRRRSMDVGRSDIAADGSRM